MPTDATRQNHAVMRPGRRVSSARQVLVDVMRERIAAMESQIDQMIVEAEIRAVNGQADESPP